MDPDLDYSTFSCALQRYEIIRGWNFDDHELVMNERRKQMILDKFADIMDVSFVKNLGKGDESAKSNQSKRLSLVCAGDLTPTLGDTTKLDLTDTSDSKSLLSLKLHKTGSYDDTHQTSETGLASPLATGDLSGDEDQTIQVVNNRKRLIIKDQPLDADFIRQKILAKIKNPQYYTMFLAEKESKVSEGGTAVFEESASLVTENSQTGHITELDEKFQLRKQIQQ